MFIFFSGKYICLERDKAMPSSEKRDCLEEYRP